MTPKRFIILLLGMVGTIFLTSLGLITVPSDALSIVAISFMGFVTLILVFGVEIQQIEVSRDGVVIDFERRGDNE